MGPMIKQLYTAGGPLSLVYLPYFADSIARVQIQDGSNYIHYPVMNTRPGVYTDFECTQPVIESHHVEPKPFMTITNYQIMMAAKSHNPTAMSYMVEALLEPGIKQAIMDEFKIIVAKTTPAFFLKDLNMDAMQDLANKYYMEFGDDGAFGIEMSLSPYQKYFIICSDKNFKFHYHHYREFGRDAVVARGALINYAPTKFIMGRYENLEYMKELSARMIYQK